MKEFNPLVKEANLSPEELQAKKDCTYRLRQKHRKQQ
jgi:hypothetical protein